MKTLKMRLNVKKQLKLPLIQLDQPFHPVILYENYLIRIVMNINKTSNIAYWLSSKGEGTVGV